ncbi:hypothetical protein GOBAR_AA12111 [Gossypium barbadense]|uniref:Uncharacterized protein n=1 Tax=Gossypium barbadense TaxID=3634 RepID=A0A2P5XYW6_GOSBA|nr:hypothetical protein GOBAR_AA12111 [Gossypium barbadense]
MRARAEEGSLEKISNGKKRKRGQTKRRRFVWRMMKDEKWREAGIREFKKEQGDLPGSRGAGICSGVAGIMTSERTRTRLKSVLGFLKIKENDR